MHFIFSGGITLRIRGLNLNVTKCWLMKNGNRIVVNVNISWQKSLYKYKNISNLNNTASHHLVCFLDFQECQSSVDDTLHCTLPTIEASSAAVASSSSVEETYHLQWDNFVSQYGLKVQVLNDPVVSEVNDTHTMKTWWPHNAARIHVKVCAAVVKL